MKKRLMLVVVLFLSLALVFSSGCVHRNRDVPATEQCGEEDVAAVALFPVELVDQKERKVTISGPPEKIVSLSPGNTEIAFSLGLGELVVGVTDFCNYPPEVEEKERVGCFADPSVEKIVALEPCFVLADSIHKEVVEKLEEVGITVIALFPGSVEAVYDSLELVGKAAGATDEADSLIAEMQGRIEVVQDNLAFLSEDEKVSVYFEVWHEPLMSVGSLSVIHEIISLAGGTNIFADIEDNFPVVSAEVVVESEPEVILVGKFHGGEEMMLQRSGWEGIPALRDQRIYVIDDDIFTRPGPRLVEAIEEAAMLFYPELF